MRLSLRGMSPRTATTLGLGSLAALAGVGLLARSAGNGNLKDLTRPLHETRWVKSRKADQQLEW